MPQEEVALQGDIWTALNTASRGRNSFQTTPEPKILKLFRFGMILLETTTCPSFIDQTISLKRTSLGSVLDCVAPCLEESFTEHTKRVDVGQ